jgi:hypothetical protein
MPGIRRSDLSIEAERRNREQLTRVGREIREARHARRLTHQRVGDRASVGRMVVCRIELGRGGGVSIDHWQQVAMAVVRPLVLTLQRDLAGEPADAPHPAIQELFSAVDEPPATDLPLSCRLVRLSPGVPRTSAFATTPVGP